MYVYLIYTYVCLIYTYVCLINAYVCLIYTYVYLIYTYVYLYLINVLFVDLIIVSFVYLMNVNGSTHAK